MDSTTVTTVVHTTFLQGIQSDLTPTGWFLLFLGWLMYWLKGFNAARLLAKGIPFGTWTSAFWQDNFLEIPISAISCLVLAILAKDMPTSMIDLHGTLAVFIVGYTSSSVLNGLITMSKKSN